MDKTFCKGCRCWRNEEDYKKDNKPFKTCNMCRTKNNKCIKKQLEENSKIYNEDETFCKSCRLWFNNDDYKKDNQIFKSCSKCRENFIKNSKKRYETLKELKKRYIID